MYMQLFFVVEKYRLYEIVEWGAVWYSVELFLLFNGVA
jgi:hypothetical protein